MQLACSLKTFGLFEIGAALASIRQAGYDNVELVLGQASLAALQNGDTSPLEIHEQALRHELQVSSLVLAAPPPLESPARESILAGLEATRPWPMSVVILQAGAAEADTPQRRELVQNLRAIGDGAAALGVKIALETRHGVCGDSRSMAQLITEVDHPHVRLNLDLGAYQLLNPGASVEIALQRLIGIVASVRVTDAEAQPPLPRLLPLGLGGEVDFAAVWQLLRTVAFPGPVTVHLDPDWQTATPRGGKPPTLQQCQRWLTDSTMLLRDCGWLDR